MIYTRIGNQVEIIAVPDADGFLLCNYTENPERVPMCRHLSELKADGGTQEVWDAINALAKQ